MAFTIHVENFQSLLDVDVEVDGFTVITGTNNSGKSALMRAIRGAFQNTRGNSFIRHGKTKSVVELKFADGHTLRWEKGKGAGDKPTFIIDGGKPIYPGQGVPDEVRALGVRPIIAGGREIWPQFAPQFTGQVFLLNEPGSVLADAVADVNRVSQLNEALRMAESDRRAASSELKVRLIDQTNLESSVQKYNGLDEVALTIDAIDADITKATKLYTAIQTLTSLRDKLKDARDAVARLEGVELIDVPGDDCIDPIKNVAGSIDQHVGLRTRLVNATNAVAKLDGVETIDVPNDDSVTEIKSVISDIDSYGVLHNRLNAANNAVRKLAGLPTIEDLDASNVEKMLNTLTALDDIHVRWAKVIQDIASLEQELASSETNLNAAGSDIATILGGMDECPTCGRVATEDHVGH